MFLYLTLSELIKIVFCYIVIDKPFFKDNKNKLFIFLITIVCGVVANSFTFISVLFLFLFLFFLNLNVRNTNELDIFYLMTSILFPFIMTTGLNLIIHPFVKNALLSGNITYFYLVELINYILLFLISSLVSKYLLDFFKRNHLEKLIFTIFIGLFFVNLSYNIYLFVNMNNAPLIFGSIILFFAILFFLIIHSLSDKQHLQVEVESQKIEQRYLRQYANEMQEQYDELRKFKHDYTNILSSLDYFISLGDVEKLKEYYTTSIQPTQQIFEKNSITFRNLENIQAEDIKSILAIKLMLAKEKNIDVKLEVPDQIPAQNSLSLIRMLGIVLDNSIEELDFLKGGTLQVGIFDLEKYYLFIIKNNHRPNIESLYQLQQPGYSSKGENRGIGLSNLMELSKKESHIALETEITEKFFIQKITVLKDDIK